MSDVTDNMVLLFINRFSENVLYHNIKLSIHVALFLLRLSRVSLSDGSESDSSSPSPPSRNEAPPLLKTTNNQVS